MRRHESGLRAGNYLLTTGLALGALLVAASVGYENGLDQALTSKGAGSYCSDAPEDRAKPLRVEHGMLIVAIHGECNEDPESPVGVYHKTRRSERAAKVFKSGEVEFAARCFSEGQDTPNHATATYEGPYHTSSNIWLSGVVPEHIELGKVNISRTETGFVEMELGTYVLKHC